MFWEWIRIHSNFFISSLDIWGFKGWLSNEKCVDNNSQTPNIDFIRMTSSSIKNFWSDIIGCTTNSSLFFSIEFKFSSKTKISKFNFHFIIQEKISEFKISMNDSVGMEVFEWVDNLDNVTLDLEFHKSFSSLDEFIECLVWTKLKKNVDIFRVFKYVLELDYMDMVEWFMDLDFRNELLSSSILLESIFGDYFGCHDSLIIKISYFVTFSKSSFSEKFTSHILFEMDFTINFGYFFFDYLVFSLLLILIDTLALLILICHNDL